MAYRRASRRRTTARRSRTASRSYNRPVRRSAKRNVRGRRATTRRAPAQRLIIQVEHTAPGEVARPSMPEAPTRAPRKAKF